MQASDVKVTGKRPVKARPGDVDRVEAALWISFPAGYRGYVTSLGEGELGGFVRVYPPWRVARELAEWRDRVRRYWFWDKGRKVLPKERALECVIVADTTGDDELVFHPSWPGRLFVLPRESETVFEAGKDLWSAVEWMLASGNLTEPIASRDFVPFDSRKQRRAAGGARGKEDPPGESADDILAAARRWAKRHGLVRQARKGIVHPLGKLPDKQLKVTVGRQSVVFAAGEFEAEGFAVKMKLADTRTGLDVGHYEFTAGADGESRQFVPEAANWATLKKRYGDDRFG